MQGANILVECKAKRAELGDQRMEKDLLSAAMGLFAK
jgi:hypothetical protein